jgi:hypothetical protein
VTIKATMLLQETSNLSNPSSPQHRIGGWSESWYLNTNSFPAAIADMISPTVPGGPICQARAGILATSAAIVGVRFQAVAPLVGPSQSLAVAFPGSWSSTIIGLQPQIALLCKVPSLGTPNIRRMILRGLPPGVVNDGEFRDPGAFLPAFGVFAQSLSGVQFRGRDLSQPATRIIAISAAGVVTCEAAITVAPLQMVRILRTVNAAGTKIGGRFQVTSVGPGSNVFTLLNWTAGLTALGNVRPDAIIYPTVDTNNIAIGRLITRRVGRPFTQYRGRRSARIR